MLLVAVLLVACTRHESPPALLEQKKPMPPGIGQSVAHGTLRRARVETEYGVAVPAGSDVAALEKLARTRGPDLEVTRTTLTDMLSDEQLAVVTKSLERADADGLKASSAVILLRGSGTDAMALARKIAGVTRDIADTAKGWVLDPETWQVHPFAAFHDHVPGAHPDARKLIVVHTITGGNEQPWLDTAGLHRYGFPELYFSEAAARDLKPLGHVLNGAAQGLLDGLDVDEDGQIVIDFHRLDWNVAIGGDGTGKAIVKTRWAKEHDASDVDDPVVELVPPSGEGVEGVTKLIDGCFGHEPDKMVMLEADDPELLAAAEKARGDLVRLRAHFAMGIPPDEELSIKARFTDEQGQVEWMWVDVVAFGKDSLEGTLANQPDVIKSLRDGQKVKVKLANVADYVHKDQSGELAGGYSIEVLKKRGF